MRLTVFLRWQKKKEKARKLSLPPKSTPRKFMLEKKVYKNQVQSAFTAADVGNFFFNIRHRQAIHNKNPIIFFSLSRFSHMTMVRNLIIHLFSISIGEIHFSLFFRHAIIASPFVAIRYCCYC